MGDIGYFWVEWPYARLRRELETRNGEIVRFVYKLEYDMAASVDGLPPHDWREVARFDHDADSEMGHDVHEEGLHLDIYRDGEKYRTLRGFPPLELKHAPAFCQRFLVERAERREILTMFNDAVGDRNDGMRKREEGVGAWNGKRYTLAERDFEDAEEHFRDARSQFQDAQEVAYQIRHNEAVDVIYISIEETSVWISALRASQRMASAGADGDAQRANEHLEDVRELEQEAD